MLGLSVCVRRERDAPTPKPSPKRQRNPATASRPRWGLYPRAARGWGAHLAVGLCTGPRRWPGYFLPRPACVVRVANQLRGGGSYRRAVARHRGPPDRSQRAQRAQLVSAEAGSVPCPSAHSSASSTLPPAISAKAARLPGAARRCGSPHWPWCGGWARKEARKSCKSCKYPGLRRNTWQWREPARPPVGRNDAHA